MPSKRLRKSGQMHHEQQPRHGARKTCSLTWKDHMLGLTRSLAGWCTKQESFMLVFYCESPVFLGLLSWGRRPDFPTSY